MKKTYLLFLLCCLAFAGFGQVTNSESFDGTFFPPTGWSQVTISASAAWARATSTTEPTGFAPHSGAGLAWFNSYSVSSGTQVMITPVFSLASRGSATPTVTFWMLRDATSYNSSAYGSEGIHVYINTTASLTGATSICFVPRAASLSPTGTVTGTATTSTGWYQYTCSMPAGFSGAANYICFSSTSQFGDDTYMDDVSWQSYSGPGVTATPTSVSFGGVTTGSTASQVFSVTGTALTAGPLTVNTTDADFSFSFDNSTFYTSAQSLTYTTPGFTTIPIYVRYTPSATGAASGNITFTGGGLTSTFNEAVSGTGIPPCSGTPTAGTASITPGIGGTSTSFSLSLAGTTVAGGLTYQWQSSPDSTTWTDISGATNTGYTFSGLTSSAYYHCNVTCTNSSTTTASNGVRANYFTSSSCIPTCAAGSASYYVGTTGNPVIVTGISGSISDASVSGSGTGGSIWYYDKTATLNVAMYQGATYSATIGAGQAYNAGQIWIDFNDDGIFQSTETVAGYSTSSGIGGARNVVSVVIPTSANAGTHRMRVMNGYCSTFAPGASVNYPNYPQMNPCPNATIPVYYADTRDYAVSITVPPPCTGTPTAGTASITPTTGSSSTSFSLSLPGAAIASGLTYQWQSSADSATWTNISGATNGAYSFSGLTVSKYYRCNITCTNSSTTSASNSARANYLPSSSCTPTCSSGSTSYYVGTTGNPVIVTGISGTSISDASVSGSGTSGSLWYYDKTATLNIAMYQGGTYSATIGAGSAYNSGQIWIDFNDDGIFQSTETVGGYSTSNGTSGARNVVSLLIPTGANTGMHRMRVMNGYCSSYGPGVNASYPNYPQMNPCPNTTIPVYYADTRDYAVNVTPPPACTGTPTAGTASVFPTSGTAGTPFTLSLSGTSVATGLAYQWQSSADGSTWTNIAAATNNIYSFTGISANSYFRCNVTCTGSSSTSVSSSAFAIYLASACIPNCYYGSTSYYAGTTGNPVIVTGISGASISDASVSGSGTGGSPWYYDKTATLNISMYQGGTYAATIGAGYYENSGQIWIDFNDDGVFQSSETVGGYSNTTCCTIGARNAVSVVIPIGANAGLHRMRVMNGYNAGDGPGASVNYPDYPQMNPCPNTTIPVYYADTRDYAVNITVPAACTGTPTAGTSAVSPAEGIATTPFTLSLSGVSVASALAFQWQSSADSSTWTNITGATTPAYTYTGITANTYFRCNITCTGSSATAASSSCMAFYFTPSSCIPACEYGNTSYYVGTTGNPVIINGITGSSISDASTSGAGTGGSAWYYDKVATLNVTMYAGGTYSATIGAGMSDNSGQIWIDFNDDGIFQSTETAGGYSNVTSTSGARNVVSIPIPPGANTGLHRMRVMNGYNSGDGPGVSINYPDYPQMNPCPDAATVYYADTRDYAVNITPPAVCTGAPTAGTSAITPSSGIATSPFTLNLTGTTLASGLTYQWQSSANDSTWTNISGATSIPYSFTGITANTYYRCSVTCTATATAASSSVSYAVFLTPSSCTPTCSSGSASYYAGTTGNPVLINGITGSSISDASVSGAGTGGSLWYYNNVAMSVTMNAGGTYAATIGAGYYDNSGQIWIDFNDDGIFQSSETVGGYSNTSCCTIGARNAVSVVIPIGANAGLHRMRVINGYNGGDGPGVSVNYPDYPQMNPCPNTTIPVYYADTRDYAVNITTPPPVVSASPASLSFGPVTVSAVSPSVVTAISGFFLCPGGTMTVTPSSTDFQVSPDNMTWYTSTAPYTFTYPNYPGTTLFGSFTSTILYVRFTPSAVTSYSGNITITGGCMGSAVNIAVTGSGATSCSGTPTAGTATINSGSTASGSSSTVFTLNTTGTTSAAGLTYQWQSSATGTAGTFANIAGANTIPYSYTGLAANTWFQCVVTCASSGSAITNTVSATFTFPSSSCIPTASNTGTTTYASTYYVGNTGNPVIITGVTGTSISDASVAGAGTGGSAQYYNNTASGVTFNAGGTYGATMGYASACYMSGSVWIDFNDDGVFNNSNELVGGYGNSGCTITGRAMPSIVIPAGAAPGSHRMRVMTEYNGGEGPGVSGFYPCYPLMNPCPQGTTSPYVYYADARDYKATIIGSVPTVASAPSSISFGNVTAGTSSVPVAFSAISGVNLSPATGYLTITTPAGSGFLVSTNGILWSNSAYIAYTGGTLAGTNLYVQFNPLAVTSYSSNISINGGGLATAVTVPVTGNGAATCTGTPSAGTASISPGSGGPASAFTLSVAGTTDAGGLTYQWQSGATSAGTFTNITGANTSTYNFIGAAGTFYQCVVTCPSGSSSTSNAVSATGPSSDTIAAATCSPASSMNCYSFGDWFMVTLTGASGTSINTPTNGCPSTASSYDNEVGVLSSVTMYAANNYTGTITVGETGGPGLLQVWIDFNNNGTFETSEMVLAGSVSTSAISTPYTYTLAIPATALGGTHRMRYAWNWGGGGSPLPCTSYSYGEVRDFACSIIPSAPPCSGTPGAGIVSLSQAASCTPFSPTLFNVGETIANTGISYQWQSSTTGTGGWTNVSGATGQAYSPGTVSAAGTVYYRNNVTCAGAVTNTASTFAQAVTLLAVPAAISGTTSICEGATATLSNTVTGGTWSSSSTATATINSSGVVTGLTAGTTTISYTLPTGCGAAVILTVNTAPSAITGTMSVCAGSTTALSNAVSGGTWSSSDASIAAVDGTGTVTGVSAGTAVMTYTIGSCIATAAVTINPLPDAGTITGASSVCVGSSLTLTGSVSGGSWSSSNSNASVSGGIVTGAAAGTVVISYSVTNGCGTAVAMQTVTVNPLADAGTITGSSSVCTGSAVSYSSSVSGGTWSSSSSSVAAAGSTGIITGVAAGSAMISYTVTNGCSSDVASQPITVIPILSAASITGASSVNMGASITLSDATGGGSWSVSNSNATVSSAGVVTGVAAGTVTVSYTVTNACSSAFATKTVTVNFAVTTAITGTLAVCAGSTTALSNATSGGTWSSSATTKATIGSASGIVTGVSAGTATISYNVSGSIVTAVVTVDPLPAAITGTATVCDNTTTTLSSTSSGGAWSSNDTTIAGIDAGTGIVSGNAAGTVSITYTLSTGCFITKTVTVHPSPAAITGSSVVCMGTTITLADATTPATGWSSGNTAVATVIAGSGVVTGISSGTVNITYTITTGCKTATTITVNALPAAITGIATVCAGSATTLMSDIADDGSWSSSNTAVATVLSSGVVSGIAAGTARITYTSGVGCFRTLIVTVNPVPNAITGTATICLGSTSALSTTSTGGTWSSSDPTIATVGSTGIVSSISAGTASISYTLSTGCSATALVTVTSGVSDIMGGNIVCVGKTIALSDSTGGGTWSSSVTTKATIGASTGILTGVAAGTSTITYAVTAGCRTTLVITVNPVAAAITGAATVCVNSSSALTTTNTGGTWSSSNTAIGTVDASGNITGVSAGTVTFTYTLSTGCFATKPITVNPLPAAITGSSAVCIGSTITLADATTPATGWSSGNTAVATVVGGSGVVTGVSAGTVDITYTITSGCKTATTITVNALPAAITGTAAVCAGSATTLNSDTTGGGSWSSSNSAIATVSSGIVTGVAAGTARITYTSGLGCFRTVIATVTALPAAITGTTTICLGSTSALHSTTTGGTWSSSDSSTASVGSTGIVTGITAGTAIISYMAATGCYRTAVVTISSGVPAITGSMSVCVGKTTALSDPTTGGTWSSSNTLVASVVSTTGVVTGVAAGTANITYAVSAGCKAIAMITVNAAAATLSGTTSVCINASITLTTTNTGGTWSSSNTATGTVDSSGNVTGIAAGAVTITYTLSTGCFTTKAITVKALPLPIAGATSVCVGSTGTISDPTTGGISWTSGNTSVATVGATSGVVTGISAGTATITYLISTGCSITTVETVNSVPSAISGSATVCAGSTTALSVTSSGSGTWSSSNTTVATTGSAGLVTGVSAGTARITFSAGAGCNSVLIATVVALPNAITGATTVCAGSATALSSTTTGGTWSSSDAGTASVGSTGIVTGNMAGTATISYTGTTGCSRTTTVTVGSGIPAISGTATVCAGTTTSLSDSVTGGTWSSSNTAIATITSGGIASGIASGTANITYTTSGGCRAIATLTVNAAAASITGSSSVCTGASTTLSETATGGTWSSSDETVATVDGSGSVTGVAIGSAVITYTLATGCYVTRTIMVSGLPSSITGTASACTGGTATLTDATTGGTWSSANTSVATIGSVSGVLSGVTAGTVTISYTTAGGCAATITAAVNANASITGTLALCAGSTTSLSVTTTGGTWTSGVTGVATVDASGNVTGVASGASTISYVLPGGCVSTAVVTVNPLPAVITGTSSLCSGSTVTLTDATTGGTWSSSDSTLASVSASGVVTGLSSGSVTISYTLSTGCARGTTVTVSAALPSITGTASACVGATTALGDATTGGTWSSGATSIATVSVSGVVSGVAAGTATITYATAGGCATTQVVTINAGLPANTGTASVTAGYTTTLSNTVSGGTWASSNTSVATVNSSGIVTGVAAGTSSITYSSGCNAITTVTVLAAPSPITGTFGVCVGSSTTLGDASPGTSWTSNTTSVATIGVTSGVLTGVSAGTATITYLTTSGSIATAVVTVSTAPPAITGSSTVCAGSTTMESDATTGGIWSSSTAAATVNSTSGIVTGVTTGVSVISYSITGCVRTLTVTVNPVPAVITGSGSVCTGSTSALGDVTTGGTWSSADAGTATVGSTGITTGIAAGTTSISYTLTTGCYKSLTVTVSAITANSGGPGICAAATTAFTNTTTGGTWSSSNASIATIVSSTGVASGVAAGTVNITYTLSAGCRSITNATVNPAAAAIGGTLSVCLGATSTLTDVSTGGTWTSSNTSFATVDPSTGVVSGVALGTPTITYTLPTGCFKTASVPVKALPAAIGGPATVCPGSTVTVTDATSPGLSWASSTPSVATVGATSGVVTGVSTGTTTITYTATTGCYATRTESVGVTPPAVSGPASVSISGSATSPAAYTDASAGGTWASSNTVRATIGSATGLLTGHSAGTVNVSYTLLGCSSVMTVSITSPREAGAAAGNAGNSDNSVVLYPNPTNGKFSIRAESAGTLAVFTMEGKMVQHYDIVAGITGIELPAGTASGIYMCRYNGNDGSTVMVRLVYEP